MVSTPAYHAAVRCSIPARTRRDNATIVGACTFITLICADPYTCTPNLECVSEYLILPLGAGDQRLSHVPLKIVHRSTLVASNIDTTSKVVLHRQAESVKKIGFVL